MPSKVTQFPEADRPLSGAEIFGFVQGGVNAKVTADDVVTDLVDPLIANLQSQIDGLSVSDSSLLPSGTISTATYTIQSTDVYIAYELTYSGAVVITIPLNASEAVPVGARIRFADLFGSASFTLEDPGIAVVSLGDAMTSAGPNAIFEAYKVGTDRWHLLGDLQA
jgi:hypothetical protein